MQLTLPLADASIQTVTAAESRSRSRSAKRDGLKRADTTLHVAVLSYVAACGSNGATRNEIAEGLGIALSSVCGRVNELLNVERPKLYVSSVRRDGRSVLVARV